MIQLINMQILMICLIPNDSVEHYRKQDLIKSISSHQVILNINSIFNQII